MATRKTNTQGKINAKITVFVAEGEITYKVELNDGFETVLTPPANASFNRKEAAYNYALKHARSHVEAMRAQAFEPTTYAIEL